MPTLIEFTKIYQKRSSILFWCLVGLIILSVSATYYKTLVLRDFVVIDDLEETLEE